jgi:5-methylcytosine-specific restriction endonuclease McrA
VCKRKQARKQHYYNLGHTRCHYCCVQLNYAAGHKNSATVEHIIPKSKGGTLRESNCLIVCKTCNGKRKNKDFKGFVSGSRFPRRDWLFGKYEKALAEGEITDE